MMGTPTRQKVSFFSLSNISLGKMVSLGNAIVKNSMNYNSNFENFVVFK